MAQLDQHPERRTAMGVFEVDLIFAVEVDDADQAAEAFGDWLGSSKSVEVRVKDTRSGETSYLDVQL